ncbi:Rz-like lysis system protein LysB [Sodalis sp. RH15]|uniref:Rz-like lysis system protein LysB n=1 Tax=Sodalis sp. RH15 TaxID=3394330 RepID=UPI0039B5ACC1
MRLLNTMLLSAAIFIAALLWFVAEQNNNLGQQSRIVDALSDGIESRDRVISRLQQEAQDQAQAELALRHSLTAAGSLAQKHEQQIQKLLNDNQTLREWYSAALPDAAIRLHQRPAFASAADYLRWLSEGEQLPDTGEPT